MPSSLICLTIEVNQRVSDILVPFQIRWNKSVQRWDREKNVRKEVLHFLARNFVIYFVWLPLCLGIFEIYFSYPGAIQTRHFIITVPQLLIVVVSIVFEILTLLHTGTLIRALNMTCEVHDDEWFQTEILRGRQSRVLSFGKLRGNFSFSENVTGVVVFISVFGTTIAIIAGTMIILYAKWDPIYLLLEASGSEKLTNSLPLIAIRWMVTLSMVHVAMTVCRYSILFYVYAGMVKYRILNSMLKAKPKLSRFCIRMYHQITIQMSEFKPVLILVSTGVLSTFFWAIIMGVIAAMVGIMLGEIILQFAGTLMFMISIGIIQTTFFFCCHIYEDSAALVAIWSYAAGMTKDGGYLKRVVQSMRVISVPAGRVGVFDKEIKMNYFYQVVGYTTDILMITKEFIDN